MKHRALAIPVTICAVMLIARGLTARQSAKPDAAGAQSMSGMDMGSSGEPAMNAATPMMSSHHMHMGPHMKMTELREPQPGDQQRADEVVTDAREVMQKYADYHNALHDGFKIFLPNVPQQQYHFTNYRYSFEAGFRFNPEHPTSLLYDKTADGYKLVGVMYTASARASPDELNRRIPLSIARWHEHVNFCLPPKDRRAEMWQKNPQFGMAGSISTKETCEQVGGKFVPRVFGWMVHVYPNDKDAWAMEDQRR